MKRFIKLLCVSLLLISIPLQSIKAENTQISTKPLYFYSDNYLLMDADDGTILFERNGYEQVHPASITKVLTTITALELIESKGLKLSDTYTFGEEVFEDLPWDASVADFSYGETVSLEDILYGVILPSGADATRAISHHLTGDPEGLATHMNELAQKIKMTQSNFVNTSGLDDEKHVSTPYDLAILVQYAIKNPLFKTLYSSQTHTTASTEQHPEGLEFTNDSLIFAHEHGMTDMVGAKSGFTDLAQRSLSSYASKDGTNLIFISTNAPTEETLGTNIIDAINVYDYVLNSFSKQAILSTSQSYGSLSIKDAKTDFDVRLTQDILYYLPKDIALSDLNIEVKPVNENLTAPIEANSKLGTLTVSHGDTTYYQEDIVTDQEIPVRLSLKIFRGLLTLLKGLMILLVLGLVLILGIRYYNLHKIKKRRALQKQKRTRTINR